MRSKTNIIVWSLTAVVLAGVFSGCANIENPPLPPPVVADSETSGWRSY